MRHAIKQITVFDEEMYPYFIYFSGGTHEEECSDKRIWLLKQNLMESLTRLQKRSNRISALILERMIERGDPSRSLQEMQFDLMNETESYFQGYYSCLSVFSNLIRAVASEDYLRGMKTGRIKSFLSSLQTKHVGMVKQIKIMEEAREFRANIVHSQRKPLHDWMSMYSELNSGPVFAIIYFVPKSRRVFARLNMNPYSPDFEPPVDYESFYVSPSYRECHQALFEVIRKTLIDIHEAKKGGSG